MFVKASRLQLKIKGQYTNNTGLVESTLTLQTHEIEFFGVSDFTQHQHPLDMKVFKFMHMARMLCTCAYLVTLLE